MTRTIARSRDHRRLFAACALVPLMLAACGDTKPSATQATTPDTPTIVHASTPTSAPVGGGPAISPSAPASYADAEAVYREGRFAEAVQLFEAYTSTKPGNPWGYYMLGLSAWKVGDLSRAQESFDRAIALDSTHVKSYVNSARVLIGLGRNHEALERAEIALALDSTSSDARRLVARAYHSLGEEGQAIDAYRVALLADDSDVWAMNNLGVLYLDKGAPELALAPLARAVQLRSTAPVFQNNLGIALERTGHIAAARQAYEAALKADSTYSKASVSLARVNTLVADSTDTVNLEELAQVFRLQIGMWRDNAIRPSQDSIAEPIAQAELKEQEN